MLLLQQAVLIGIGVQKGIQPLFQVLFKLIQPSRRHQSALAALLMLMMKSGLNVSLFSLPLPASAGKGHQQDHASAGTSASLRPRPAHGPSSLSI